MNPSLFSNTRIREEVEPRNKHRVKNVDFITEDLMIIDSHPSQIIEKYPLHIGIYIIIN